MYRVIVMLVLLCRVVQQHNNNNCLVYGKQQQQIIPLPFINTASRKFRTINNQKTNLSLLLFLPVLTRRKKQEEFVMLLYDINTVRIHQAISPCHIRSVIPLHATISDTDVVDQLVKTRKQQNQQQQQQGQQGQVPIKTIETTHVLDDRIQYYIQKNYLPSIVGFVLYCITITGIIISIEDLLCQSTLPSRHRTELISISHPSWGQSTIGGLGFGQTERLLLDTATATADDTKLNSNIDSLHGYNEIMLHHRMVTVPKWKEAKTNVQTNQQHQQDIVVADAIGIIVNNYSTVKIMQQITNDYQWDTIRTMLHSSPITDLSQAGTVIRTYIHDQDNTRYDNPNDVIGFDWGSCSWRHQCGAVADIQESYDEIDSLLGVLEPFEIQFCLDIVERGLRDILAIIPWQLASDTDQQFWNTIPVYVSKVVTGTSTTADKSSDGTINNDMDELSKFDQEYIRALQQLKID